MALGYAESKKKKKKIGCRIAHLKFITKYSVSNDHFPQLHVFVV